MAGKGTEKQPNGDTGIAVAAPAGDLILRDPGILEGKPVLAGTRMGVHAVIGYWQTYAGDVERILREFPPLTRDQIDAALTFTARMRAIARRSTAFSG